MKRLVSCLAALAVVAAAAPAWADDNDPHREGVYSGVRPIAPDAEHRVKHRHARAKKTLHWIGFQQRDGMHEVFLAAAEPFTVEQRVEGGALVLSVAGLTKLGPNARRPVDTSYFDGPVTRITAKVRKARRAHKGQPATTAGVDLTLSFRDGKAAPGQLHSDTDSDGMHYVYLTLATGGGTVTPSEPATP